MCPSSWLKLKGIVLGSSLGKSVDPVLSNITRPLSLLAVISFALALWVAGHSLRETESHQPIQAFILPAQQLWTSTQQLSAPCRNHVPVNQEL